MNVDTMPDLLGLFLGKVEERLDDWFHARAIEATKRDIELTEREIAEKLESHRRLTKKLVNLERNS